MIASPTRSPSKGRSGSARFFLRGLAVLLPSIVTLWILWSVGTFLYDRIAEPINGLVRRGVIAAAPRVLSTSELPAWYNVTDEQIRQARVREPVGTTPRADDSYRDQIRNVALAQYWDDHWTLKGAGLLLAVGVTFTIGLVLNGIVGRRLYARAEAAISALPGFKQVYPHVKQLVELVFGDRRMAFRRVVLVEFPRPGAWAVAFVTSDAMRQAGLATGDADAVTVFVPTTPTPFTGFTLSVRAKDLVDLPISIDEAIRYMITGGVLIPGSQKTEAPEAPARLRVDPTPAKAA